MPDLILGKSGAILLGYPNTAQDADLFVEKNPEIARRSSPHPPNWGLILLPPSKTISGVARTLCS